MSGGWDSIVKGSASRGSWSVSDALRERNLLKDSFCGYGQVRQREGNMLCICSILLNVRISNTFGNGAGGMRNVRFNLTEGSTYVYTVWKILSFECNCYNISWVLATATRVNGKTEHMNYIMLKIIRRPE